jgi:hypothetical protein
MPHIGSIKVPKDWVVTYRDDFLYLTDRPLDEKGCQTYLMGMVNPEVSGPLFEQYEGVEHLGKVKSSIAENSTFYSLDEFRIDGNVCLRYVVYLIGMDSQRPPRNKGYALISWDDLLSKRIISKIARSFVRHLD